MPPQYYFSYIKGGEVVFRGLFRHLFKAELALFLESQRKQES